MYNFLIILSPFGWPVPAPFSLRRIVGRNKVRGKNNLNENSKTNRKESSCDNKCQSINLKQVTNDDT